MAINYNPTTWVDNTTPVNAQYLNNIEQGIVNATSQINTNTNNIATNTSTINQHSADIAEIQQEISGGVGGGDAKESTSQEILSLTSHMYSAGVIQGFARKQIIGVAQDKYQDTSTITSQKTYTIGNITSNVDVMEICCQFSGYEFSDVKLVFTDIATNKKMTWRYASDLSSLASGKKARDCVVSFYGGSPLSITNTLVNSDISRTIMVTHQGLSCIGDSYLIYAPSDKSEVSAVSIIGNDVPLSVNRNVSASVSEYSPAAYSLASILLPRQLPCSSGFTLTLSATPNSPNLNKRMGISIYASYVSNEG